jgi:REP element-mobilizing transposase RayT
MSRPLRIEFAGALYHVMSRGNERANIVRDDRDRQKRLDWLRRTVETYGWRLHWFVLMTNHDHLFVETPEPNLSAGMQYFNGSYTSYFNRRHSRAGHLFQGRFKGNLFQETGYFLQVSRYLHLNPVRANMVARPEDYRWSSYRGYQRARRSLDWVCYDQVLGEFGQDPAQARRRYVRFVCEQIGKPLQSPFADAVGGLLLGAEDFIDRMQHLLSNRTVDRATPQLGRLRHRPPLTLIIHVVAKYFGTDVENWKPRSRHDDVSRSVVAYLARCEFGYPAKETADALGYRSHGSVRNAVLRIERGSDRLQRDIRKLKAILTND